jgi:hypothetical protein
VDTVGEVMGLAEGDFKGLADGDAVGEELGLADGD